MEEDKIKTSLDEVIANDLDKISEMEIGSEERSKAINELTKLHALRAEEEKLAIDGERVWYEENSSEKEEKRRAEQAEIDAKERKFNRCMLVANLMVPIVTYGVYYYTGLKVDAEGKYIPGPVRELCKHFRPTKK